MQGPVAALLGDGSRLHLQHGPIDLVIGADPLDAGGRQRAFEVAARRFSTVLEELVGELALLRRPPDSGVRPRGRIARRMDRAVRPHARGGFVTLMAAVAGAVADEVLGAMTGAVPLARAYVNNGGDIALHLRRGAAFSAAIAGLDGAEHGRITIDAASDVRGIASSGQGGRSLSLGIADSVSVLAATAAEADAAATLIANAVDLPAHPAVIRVPARDLDPDSDLGARAVVTRVGPLMRDEVDEALGAGERAARAMTAQGRIIAAALFLRGSGRIVGAMPRTSGNETRTVTHA